MTLKISSRLMALFMACRTSFLVHGTAGSNFPIGATVLGVAPCLWVLGAKIQPTEDQADLLRRAPARDQLIALADCIVDQVFIDLGEMGLACQHLRKARWLFNR